MTRRPFTIAGRLAASFGVVVAMLALVSYFALAGLVDVHRRLHRVKEDESKARSALHLASALCDQYAHIAHTIILANDTHVGFFDEAIAKLGRLEAEVRAQTRNPAQLRALADILKASREIERIFRSDILPAIVRGDRAGLPRQHDRILELTTRAQEKAEDLVNASEAAMEDFRAHAQAVQHGVIRWTLIVHLMALVAAGIVGFYLYRSIARPIAALASAAARVSAGDLDTEIPVERGDELGKLAGRFNEMTKALAEHQARLIQTEKLAGLGRVAAGIAHEINNPLGVILGYAKLLRRRGAGDVDKDIAIIEDEAERCRRVVEELLDLTRPLTIDATDVELRALVEEVAGRVSASSPQPSAPVAVEGSAIVRGSDTKLRQVMMNLVKNASEAAGSGGAVRIEIRARDNGTVTLDIADTGLGVRAEDEGRLFEPFFTTKASGSGLGLAVSRAIARAHGGDLELAATSERGAVFRLTLPTVQGARA
jgi:two-component system, NtrC family, sensor kinase